jgi:hypothetical protein
LSPRAHRIVVWAAFALPLVLHLDSWRPKRAVIWLGWLPEELLYRLAWMLLAWVYLLYVCRYHWRADEP